MARYFEPVQRFSDIDDFILPQRSTSHSAGYDFFAPEDIVIPSHLKLFWNRISNQYRDPIPPITPPYVIKLGVKAMMEDDEVLQIYGRSSTSMKFGLVSSNSVGIIDKDYYGNEENDGEIGFIVYNLSSKDVKIKKGTKICQGVFTKFLKTDDDEAKGSRNGGFGSTGVE